MGERGNSFSQQNKKPMEFSELERVVGLHKKGYDILLWLKQAARSKPRLLSEDETDLLASGEKCVFWVKRHLNDLPLELRPSPDDFRPVGYLLSSFFHTSFRVAEVRGWDTVETTLVRGAKSFKNARHKRHSDRRETQAAIELKRIAITTLAEDCGVSLAPESREPALTDPEIAHDLTLWTYGCELVRRTEFAPQGSSVHRLWLELDEKARKRFSAESIWQARERLERWLRSKSSKPLS